MTRQFQRRIENFTCAHCGAAVTGNGYTNHCPQCLHSRHVDINPGDRAELCGGVMDPVAVEQTAKGFILTHRCRLCATERRCRTVEADDTGALIKLAKRLSDGRTL